MHCFFHRTIANYYLWRQVEFSIQFLSKDLRALAQEHKRRTTGQLAEEPRWKECTDIVNNRLPAAVGSLYIKRYFTSDAKVEALDMVENVKREFNKTLMTVDWMDHKTRAEAARKLAAMETLIGYPDELMDNKKLDAFYANLNLTLESFLEDILQVQRFYSTFELSRLRQVFNKTDWVDHARPADVNAYYSGIENNIRKNICVIHTYVQSKV